MSNLVYLEVWDLDGSAYRLEVRFVDRVAEAVSSWLDTQRDRLVQVTSIAGDVMVIRASTVHSWKISTPAGRKRGLEVEHELDKHRKAILAEMGIWEDDE